MKNTATLISIGDELLIGQIIDTNSVWIGQQLSDIGVMVKSKYTVGDEVSEIIDTIYRALQDSDIVIITGGLGPTQDDRTVEALCGYYDCTTYFHQESYERIVNLYKSKGRELNPTQKKQCYIPDVSTALLNNMGTAPGMMVQREGKLLVSMPGVPFEMKAIMRDHVLPLVKKQFSDHVIIHKTLKTAGIGESTIAYRIKDIEDSLPNHINLAYLPDIGQVRLRLSGYGVQRAELIAEIDAIALQIKNLLGELIYGEDDLTLDQAIGTICKRNKWTIGTAESCTGGAMASKIVSSPGASEYFLGSIVSYANDLKKNILGVSQTTLENFGAVSEETVIAMSHGAKKVIDCDVVIAVSGIAGPSGGTEDKPVGTVWLSCYDGENMQTKKIFSGKNREYNIKYAVEIGLNFMRHYLLHKEKN